MPGCSSKRKKGGTDNTMTNAQKGFSSMWTNLKTAASNATQKMRRGANSALRTTEGATTDVVNSTNKGFSQVSKAPPSFGLANVGGKKRKHHRKTHRKIHKKRNTRRNHKKKSHRRR